MRARVVLARIKAAFADARLANRPLCQALASTEREVPATAPSRRGKGAGGSGRRTDGDGNRSKAVAALGLALALMASLALAPAVLAAYAPPGALAAGLSLAPATPTPTPTPSIALIAGLTTTPSATSTPSATPTVTPTATPLPPTPTAARPTPDPSGYFVSAYQGQIQAAGLGSGLIRGRVTDYRGAGIASVPIVATTSGVAYSTAAGPDGSYAIGGLKPGTYTVAVAGYPSTPAEGIYLPPSTVVSIDFVEAARPGSSPVVAPTAGSETAEAVGSSAGSRPAVVIVVLTPEGAALARTERPTPTPRPAVEQADFDRNRLPWESWTQAFLVGVAATYGLALLGLAVASLRR